MPSFATARVTRLLSERDGLQRLELADGSRAYALVAVVGPVGVGDRVVVNTTAVELGLGTGGWHVVHWNLERESWSSPTTGHVMKLRYTSGQLDLDTDPGPAELGPVLGGRPVVVAGLHSQLAPIVAAMRARRPDWRIAYVMTDGGALPIALSELVAELRSRGLLDVTVTAGHAFGGDLEAVNVPAALCAAAGPGRADAVVVAMGPGVVGTGGPLGTTAIEVAPALDAAAALGGRPILCVRYSEADPRDRHRGVSHHVTTALRLVAHPVTVAVAAAYVDAVRPVLAPLGHALAVAGGPSATELLAAVGLSVTTMGRSVADDPGFFAMAAAAGWVAAAGPDDDLGTTVHP